MAQISLKCCRQRRIAEMHTGLHRNETCPSIVCTTVADARDESTCYHWQISMHESYLFTKVGVCSSPQRIMGIFNRIIVRSAWRRSFGCWKGTLGCRTRFFDGGGFHHDWSNPSPSILYGGLMIDELTNQQWGPRGREQTKDKEMMNVPGYESQSDDNIKNEDILRRQLTADVRCINTHILVVYIAQWACYDGITDSYWMMPCIRVEFFLIMTTGNSPSRSVLLLLDKTRQKEKKISGERSD